MQTTEYAGCTAAQLDAFVAHFADQYKNAKHDRNGRPAYVRYVAVTSLHAVALELNARRNAVAWMFEMPEPYTADELSRSEPREDKRPRSLWDLPIFGAFWKADGADLGR
ncbi:hypothetical protein ACFWIW_10805 [Amycolatopsis sp. NPDC058340]|uniref:hypothetical protein n=1 Tax=Amycolatopsis sp. NPDC058340 TaxID=3346453 RepID=UPI0036573CE9